MSKKIPKIYALHPLRALAILDYLSYLNETNECTEINAKKDGITKSEWLCTQMYIKSNLSKSLNTIREKLISNAANAVSLLSNNLPN